MDIETVLSPSDVHNASLRADVHPSPWANPKPNGRYNLVVVGGGTAGLVSAAAAAGLGAKVALIERALLGGDCLNVGCVPSKAILRSARAVAEIRRAPALGVEIPGEPQVNFAAIMERMRRLRATLSPHDSARRFQELGVDVYFGTARFVGEDVVDVDGTNLVFSKAVIATGTKPAEPDVPGLRSIDYLTNESIFSLTEFPQRLAVVGAGPIGCELSQAFARFGSQVYLIEAAHGVLPNDDRDAAAVIQQSLEADGVHVLCCGKSMQLSREGSSARISLESHGTSREITVDRLLVSAGRRPNTEGLGLEAANVEYSASGITVNDRLQTTNSRIYAAGDVCSRYKFTHAADAMARIVVQNALFLGRASMKNLVIPWCTYTDPEVAHVGLTETNAAAESIPIKTFTQPLAKVDRGLLDGEGADGQVPGFVRIHTRRGSDEMVGATIVARHAGEMISEVTLAMGQKLGLKMLAKTIHPYPTQAEAIRKIADEYNRTRLTPLVKRLSERWLAWRR